MKSNGTEVNTTKSITFSRYLTKQESINPKKMQERMNGSRKASIVVHDTMLTKLNILGTTSAKYMPSTA